MILVNTGKAVAGVAGYQGPGDIVAGAFAWYGLRAYNAAYISGTKHLVDLVDSAGNNPTTIDCTSTGAFDMPAYNFWASTNGVGADTALVVKLYDQASTHHMTQATNTARPSLAVSSGTLRIVSTGGFTKFIQSGNVTFAQAFTMSAVVQRNNDASGSNTLIFGDGGSGNGIYAPHQAANTKYGAFWGLSADSSVLVSLGVAKPIQAFVQTTTSKVYVNSTLDSGLNAGTGDWAGDPIIFSSSSSDTVCFTEGGIWSGDQSSSFSALETNQKTFWGI